ncbi:MAG TPA: cyclic peptide export ABC transporter [Crinalium sp.]|jgi:putative ATP-binding cassette transporter
MDLIHFLLRSSWKMVAIAALTGFLSGISSAALIALTSYAIGHYSSTSIPLIIGGFIGLASLALLTSIISQVTLIRLSHKAVFKLRIHLIRQILSSQLSHLEQIGNPRLLATLTEDVQAITRAVYTLPLLCIDIAIVIGCLAYIIWLSWIGAVLVFGLIGVAVLTCYRFLFQGERFLARARDEEDHLFKHFRTATEGIKELKLHSERRQAFLTEDVETTAMNFRRYNVRGMTLFAIASSLGKLLFFFATGAILFVLPKVMTVNPQTVAGFILAFIYLIAPMENITNSFPFVFQSNIALRKIKGLGLSLSDRPEISAHQAPVQSSWQTLELKNVVYPYQRDGEDTHFTLGPINLTIHAGELIFIVGGNGSGKSTFAKLLTGLYSPESGELWLDHQRIDDHTREWYRQHFSVVFADFYVFERLLGLDRTDLDQQAKTYIQKLQLDHKVTIDRGKLSTTALSQGQRKRLALLTAYLEDRPIYLFDEWAADQDPVFKDLFYSQFLPALKAKGKTVMIISHDDHYFHLADRLIKLDNGQIEFDKQLEHEWRI